MTRHPELLLHFRFDIISELMFCLLYTNLLIFFHPDYTVGFGVSPNHAR